MSGVEPPVTPILLPVQDDPLPSGDTFQRFEDTLDLPQAETLVLAPEPLPPIGRDWAFDFAARQSIPKSGGHGPRPTRGVETLRTWVEKCLRVARGAHPIYSDDFGIDLPADFFGGPVLRFPADEFEQEVRRALTVRREIVDVVDYVASFDPDEEYVAVSFAVVLAGGEQVEFRGVRIGS